jgi:DNA-binding MarR family transcriptional regulator
MTAGAAADARPEEQEEEPEPLRHVGHLIRRAQQRHAALWAEIVSSEVSSVQYAVLTTIERMPGASQAELGGALTLDRSTIADLVARLERNGLIARTAHQLDRRRYSLHLTDAGRAQTARLRPFVDEANARLTQGLSPREESELKSLLRRVVQES